MGAYLMSPWNCFVSTSKQNLSLKKCWNRIRNISTGNVRQTSVCRRPLLQARSRNQRQTEVCRTSLSDKEITVSKQIEEAVKDRYGTFAASALSSEHTGVRSVAEAFGYSSEE